VRIVPGNFHLEWLHDVEVEDPADEQILAYDATAGLWKNIDIPESAAVISSATAPANTTAIWFNTENGNTYIYYDDFWTSIAGSTGAPIISDTAPTDPVLGTQWFNSSTGKSYLYYSDTWVEIDSNGTSAVSTGNAIINGAFEINQRGFTSSTAGGFGFDRWMSFITGGTSTFSSQSFIPGAAPLTGYESSNYLRVVTSGQSSPGDNTNFAQRIEDVRTFAGQTVTLSFFAKAATGIPSISSVFFQNYGSGGSATSSGIGVKKYQLSTSWERFSATVQIPSLEGKTVGPNSRLQLSFYVSAGSDLNATTSSLGIQSNTFDIWGVQLEAGTVATPFKRNSPSIQAELAACQRYYQRYSGAGYSPIAMGYSFNTTRSFVSMNFLNTFRAAPTRGSFSNLVITDRAAYDVTVTALGGEVTSTASYWVDVTASGVAGGRFAWLTPRSQGDGFIEFSAEL
jgi:hypothetical protein